MEWAYVVAGGVVGFIVGLTGVGGGSLMTPILLAFGISPVKAVGTDLLYAAITKSGGVLVHARSRNVDWKVTGLLSCGSLPAALLTVGVLHVWQPNLALMNQIITHVLGFALLSTALAILFKKQLLNFAQCHADQGMALTPFARKGVTVLVGMVLGVVVTLSSIGAGALGTVALFLLYPLIPTSRLVGTEIAHAVPLTAIAGLGHAGLGNLDWPLLLSLLTGSLPAIALGSYLTGRAPDHILRPCLAVMLALVGGKLIF